LSDNNTQPLPLGWSIAQLRDIAEINPSTIFHIEDDSSEVNFVPMRAVAPEGGGLTEPEIRSYGEVKKGYTSFLSGDVIMAKITPCMENGKTTVVPDLPKAICFGSTEFHIVRVETGIHAAWISQFLLRHDLRRLAQRQMTGGVGQMRVPATFLQNVEIPVPPTAEQERITERLDELLSELVAGSEALHRAQAKLSLYRASVLKASVQGDLTAKWRQQHPDAEPASALLQRILTERRQLWEQSQLRKFKATGKTPPDKWKEKYKEPVAPNTTSLPSLPPNWCWATVDQCSSLLQYGSSSKTNADDKGFPVLRMGNINKDGILSLDKLKYLPTNHEEFPELLLREGDLLFNRTNSAELVGKTAQYKGVPEPCSFASYLIRVRMIELICPEIVVFSLNSLRGRSWINSVVNQTVGQANVNGTKLASFPLALPPRAEQNAIVELAEDQLSVIEHLCNDLRVTLESSMGLKQTILGSAFRGKLVARGLSDEPASVLLRRIAAEREELEATNKARRKLPAKRKRQQK
jgi:type I restriction enzyme S subunit